MSDDPEESWVVLEVVSGSAINRIRGVYDSIEAAKDYVNDPENTGQFIVVRVTVEVSWEPSLNQEKQ